MLGRGGALSFSEYQTSHSTTVVAGSTCFICYKCGAVNVVRIGEGWTQVRACVRAPGGDRAPAVFISKNTQHKLDDVTSLTVGNTTRSAALAIAGGVSKIRPANH